MRLTASTMPRVVWEDGMHLTPHHFQAQRRHHEELSARTLDALFPFAHGVSALELDADALRNRMLALVHARGVLPDGTPFDIPDSDPLPPVASIADRFSPTRDAHTVHLALAAWRADGANVLDAERHAIDDRQVADHRYTTVSRIIADETTGGDALPVKLVARNLHLVLDDDLTDALVSLPVARVRRDGSGQFVFDADYIPPLLQIGASPVLQQLLQRTVAMLEAKGNALAATLAQAPAAAAGGAAAYVGNELATRWLLHAVRSADASLRHLMLMRRAHPERLFLEMARLAGALCTFAVDTQPRDLPAYDHDDLTSCFMALERQLRTHLDVVISSRALVVPLTRTSDVLHSANVADPRAYEPAARWFIAARTPLGHAQTIDLVPRLTKVCASRFVLELVRRAFNGLQLEHLPVPPAALAPRPDLLYFEMTMAGPCALSLRETREIGIYVPETLTGSYFEVVILV